MSSTTLYRLSGYALLIGSSLAFLFEFIRIASSRASKTEQSSLATIEKRGASVSS